MTNRSSEYSGYEIYSVINLEKRPHRLLVSPNLFHELINGDMLRQNVDYSDLSTENHIGLLSAFRIGNVTLHPTFFLNYTRNSLTSELPDFNNDLILDKLNTGVKAEIAWRTANLIYRSNCQSDINFSSWITACQT